MLANPIIAATIPGDFHAHAVAEAADKLGGNVWVWPTTQMRVGQEITIHLKENLSIEINTSSRCLRVLLDNIKGLWYRRLRNLDSPNILCEADESAAANNSAKLRSSVLATLSSNTLSVNDMYCAHRAENKLLQLLWAREVGLMIPQTLMTNSSSAASEFIVSLNNRALAKQFMPASWNTSDGVRYAFSTLVSHGDVPTRKIMGADAVISQNYVDKKFEVRITWLGNHFLAVKLDSQSNLASAIDWRAVDPSALSVELIDPPDSVVESCRNLMKKMGLRFSCMDFIVELSGSWVFLELNQMGQFLWIEQSNPEIRILDLFTRFLISGGEDKLEPRPLYGVKFCDVEAVTRDRCNQEEAGEFRWKHTTYYDEVPFGDPER